MHYLEWLQRTRHMDDEQRSRLFDGLDNAGQTELMDSYAKSARVTRNGNVINRFRGRN